ncbi:MAG: oligosaccharide flippase family protein [Hyphomicrobiaceae bacterium]|nr:oligosaccharide flippase family protein [Hyphomicrobiaceae bacterium]
MSVPPQDEIGSVVRAGFWKSVASLVIKVATAGLTYLMFVVLSRTMGPVPYGQFAFGFALATVVAIGASVGQQTAILRFWPEEEVAGRPERAANAVRSGWALVLIASGVLSALLVLVALAMGLLGGGLWSVAHLFATVLLILPMAAAEYGSSVLRAQGSVWTALLPRDVIWRVLVPGAVWLLYLLHVEVSGAGALVLTALLLAVAMALQFLAAGWRHYENGVSFSGLRTYWAARGEASRWFLVGTVVDSAALNVDIVLVGLLVAEASAGIYFNAFRTAGLMTLFMFAITLVVAPMVAKHYHAGEMRQAQAVTTFNAWAGFLFSLAVFAGFMLFGDLILSLFGDHYAGGQLILIILSVGLLADAATGPTRIVMMMTGHERDYVRIFGSIMLVGMAIQVVVIPAYGLIGAAIVNAASRFVAQCAIAWWTNRHVGIETSLFGIFKLLPERAPRVQAPGE